MTISIQEQQSSICLDKLSYPVITKDFTLEDFTLEDSNCPICLSKLKDPVVCIDDFEFTSSTQKVIFLMSCERPHLFCRKCISRCQDRCAICRKDFKNLFPTNFISAFIFRRSLEKLTDEDLEKIVNDLFKRNDFNSIFRIFKNLNSISLNHLLSNLNNLEIIFINMLDYYLNTEKEDEALEIVNLLIDKYPLIQLKNLFSIYLQNKKNALKALDLILEVIEQKPDSIKKIKILKEIFSILLEVNIEKAEQVLALAQETFVKLPSEQRNLNYVLLFKFYYKIGNKQKALQIFDLAIQGALKIENPHQRSVKLRLIGKGYFKIGEKQKAEQAFKAAEEAAKLTGKYWEKIYLREIQILKENFATHHFCKYGKVKSIY